jgi:hypothetical protein
MSNKALVTALVAACSLFIVLSAAIRLQALVALALAIAGGGVVLVAVSRWWPAPAPAQDQTVPVTVTEVTPPPLQFQAHAISGVRLRSAFADYNFIFDANVLWHPSTDGASGMGEIAAYEIIRRADEITGQRNPNETALVASDLTRHLGALQLDPSGLVQVKAESIRLQLLPEDQRRLDQFARLRKEEGLWDYQRQYQMNQRRYLRTDVLKDSGSAVVWWLAKHEDDPRQVAESIDVLTRLAHAANHADGTAFADSTGPDTAPVPPQTPADRFEAFLDSLDPTPNDKVRIMLTDLVARFVDAHDQRAADEMRRRYSEPDDGNVADGYWRPGEGEGTLPE